MPIRYRTILPVVIALLLLTVTLSLTQAISPFDPVPYEPLPPDVKVETVVGGAIQVVAMDFTPDGRLLYTERTGNVRVVVNGVLQNTPVIGFPVDTQGERGLLGIAVDPGFNQNHSVWVYFTRPQTTGSVCNLADNRIVRFTLGPDNLGHDPTFVDSFPITPCQTIHNGGNLHFGPDGMLYVTVGNNDDTNDAGDPAQNLSSPLGKIHRFDTSSINPLRIPADNPFMNVPGADESNYAYGLRNSFDFAFDPIGGGLFATENGDKCDDEINRILPGGNYGWRPNYPQTPLPCDDDVGPDPAYNTIPPLIHWTPSLAPTGITFYTSAAIPEWQGDVFMCAYKDATTAIHHFKLNADRTAIVSHTILTDTTTHQALRCRTDILPGPDGALYYSEEGGWDSGPIKRLVRKSSFAATTVNPQPLNPAPGTLVDYTIDLHHIGSITNTFLLTLNVPGTYAFVNNTQAAQGILSNSPFTISWSGTVTPGANWIATYQLSVASEPTTAYPLFNYIRITAPGATTVVLTPTVIVNGQLTFLPLIQRNP